MFFDRRLIDPHRIFHQFGNAGGLLDVDIFCVGLLRRHDLFDVLDIAVERCHRFGDGLMFLIKQGPEFGEIIGQSTSAIIG